MLPSGAAPDTVTGDGDEVVAPTAVDGTVPGQGACRPATCRRQRTDGRVVEDVGEVDGHDRAVSATLPVLVTETAYVTAAPGATGPLAGVEASARSNLPGQAGLSAS